MTKRYTTKQLIALLEVVLKKHLWNGDARTYKQRHVCYAIGAATTDGRVPERLEKMIDAHLHDYGSMEGFLRDQLGYCKVNRMSKKRIQTYRFMMVNNMIRLLKEGKKA